MRALADLILKTSAAFCLATTGGCLVSEDPVLDARSGNAAPLADAVYLACPSDEDDSECARFSTARSVDGAYAIANLDEEEEPALMRFRRIARGAYAVQSEEGESYAYYFGRGDREAFMLVMMQCPALPEEVRARLIRRGDLETDDEDFEVCTVKTRAGLVAAAKAYARGDVDIGGHPAIVMTRLEDAAASP